MKSGSHIFSALIICAFSMLVTSCIKPPLHLHGLYDLRVEMDAQKDVDRMWQENWREEWTAYWDEEQWGEMFYHQPASMRMHTYTMDGDGVYTDYNIYNFTALEGSLSIMANYYDMLFHNNDTEYIRYDSQDNDNRIYAYTRTISKGLRSSQFLLTPHQKSEAEAEDDPITKAVSDTEFENQPVVYAPDQLFSVMKDGVWVPDYSFIQPDGIYSQVVKGVMDPISYIYMVQVDLLNNDGRVVGSDGGAAITGMASGVWVDSRVTSSDPVSVLFEMYMERIEKRLSKGNLTSENAVDCLVGRVMSFGKRSINPYLVTRSENEEANRNYLVLNVTYRTAEQYNIRVDITDKVKELPFGGVIHLQLDVRDFPLETISNAFDAVIEGWDEYQLSIEIR